MGTAKTIWDATYTQDGTISATINDNDFSQTAEITNDDGMQTEFAVELTYGGVYDEPAIAYILRRLSGAATYESEQNANGEPVEGQDSSAASTTFTVGPDVNAFVIRIRNDSGAQITGVTIYYKQGHILTAA